MPKKLNSALYAIPIDFWHFAIVIVIMASASPLKPQKCSIEGALIIIRAENGKLVTVSKCSEETAPEPTVCDQYKKLIAGGMKYSMPVSAKLGPYCSEEHSDIDLIIGTIANIGKPSIVTLKNISSGWTDEMNKNMEYFPWFYYKSLNCLIQVSFDTGFDGSEQLNVISLKTESS